MIHNGFFHCQVVQRHRKRSLQWIMCAAGYRVVIVPPAPPADSGGGGYTSYSSSSGNETALHVAVQRGSDATGTRVVYLPMAADNATASSPPPSIATAAGNATLLAPGNASFIIVPQSEYDQPVAERTSAQRPLGEVSVAIPAAANGQQPGISVGEPVIVASLPLKRPARAPESGLLEAGAPAVDSAGRRLLRALAA